jgi:hypothetical protein
MGTELSLPSINSDDCRSRYEYVEVNYCDLNRFGMVGWKFVGYNSYYNLYIMERELF